VANSLEAFQPDMADGIGQMAVCPLLLLFVCHYLTGAAIRNVHFTECPRLFRDYIHVY
jgi:hypothetical protein